MVAAGSVVSCDSVLPDADACGVAFCVIMEAHFASHSDWLPCPTVGMLAVAAPTFSAIPDHFLEMMLTEHQVCGNWVRRVVREPGLIEWVVLRAPKDNGPVTLRCPARL
jgi:hypothetical protein